MLWPQTSSGIRPPSDSCVKRFFEPSRIAVGGRQIEPRLQVDAASPGAPASHDSTDMLRALQRTPRSAGAVQCRPLPLEYRHGQVMLLSKSKTQPAIQASEVVGCPLRESPLAQLAGLEGGERNRCGLLSPGQAGAGRMDRVRVRVARKGPGQAIPCMGEGSSRRSTCIGESPSRSVVLFKSHLCVCEHQRHPYPIFLGRITLPLNPSQLRHRIQLKSQSAVGPGPQRHRPLTHGQRPNLLQPPQQRHHHVRIADRVPMVHQPQRVVP